MNDAARRTCAATLLLLALMTLIPPLVPPESDGLPAFDDTDGEDGAAPTFVRLSVAALPAAVPRSSGPRIVVPIVTTAGDGLPESAPRRALPPRSPPAS